jgi:hypothetical protein
MTRASLLTRLPSSHQEWEFFNVEQLVTGKTKAETKVRVSGIPVDAVISTGYAAP